MFGSIGVPELLIILAIVLLLFGVRRIPGIGKALGQTISGFRRGLREDDSELESERRDRSKALPQIESGQQRADMPATSRDTTRV